MSRIPTAEEHFAALDVCEIIRATVEPLTQEADADLVALNIVAGAHACCERISEREIAEVGRIGKKYKTAIPDYEIVDMPKPEDGAVADYSPYALCCRVISSGRRYVIKHDGGKFQRGSGDWADTLDGAMRGAE